MPPLNDDQFDSRLHTLLREQEMNEDVSLEQDGDAEDLADLALLREALSNYKAETLQFAEQKSSTLPAPHVPRVIALWDSTRRWAVAATAALALGFTSVLATHHRTGTAPLALTVAPTAQALSEDNRLLLSVNEALTPSADPTEQELGLITVPAHNKKLGRVTN